MRVPKMGLKRGKAHSTSSQDNCDQDRSLFELSNDGANKIVLDEVQYQLDYAKSKASLPARRKAMLQLITLCASTEKNVIQVLTRTGVEEVLTQLSSLLNENQDPELLASVLALFLLLLQNKDGSINSRIKVSKSVLNSLLYCSAGNSLENCSNHPSFSSLPTNIKSTDVSPVKNLNTAPAVIHRKRKFAGAAATAMATMKTQNGISSDVEVVSDIGSSTEVTPIKKSKPEVHLESKAPPFPLFTNNKTYSSPTKGQSLSSSQISSPTSGIPLEVYAEKYRNGLSNSVGNNFGNISTTVRFLWPVMFSILSTSTTSDPILEDIEMLRLIIIDRYLTSKVNLLTSTMTSGYSDQQSKGEIHADFNDNESDLLLQEVTDCQTALRVYHSGNNKALSRNNSINSQTESRKSDSSEIIPYLKQLFNLLIKEVEVLNASPASSTRGNVAKICIILSILETSCYKNPANQVFLSKLKQSFRLSQPMSNTHDYYMSDESRDSFPTGSIHLVSLPTLLVDMLHCITPQMMKSLCSMIFEQQCMKSKHLKNKDLHRFFQLFQEYSVLNTITSNDMENDDPSTVVDLSVHKLFISCLECLISLTNDNEKACNSLLSYSVNVFNDSTVDKKQTVVEFLFSLLAYGVMCRAHQQDQKQQDSSRGSNSSQSESKAGDDQVSGALSPTETQYERFIFDLVQFTLTLLTNVAEFSYKYFKSKKVSNYSLNLYISDCLKKNSSLKSWLPSAIFKSSITSQLAKTFYSSNIDCHDLLIQFILNETGDFFQDFVDTDEAINNNNNVITATNAISSGHSGNDAVPIAELILASHGVLLLHTLTVVTIDDSSADKQTASVKKSGATSQGNSANDVSYEFVLCDVRPKLPRHNWWLCIRILKAYMSLQLQTGIMILDTVTPVLKTIQSMTAQDTQIVVERKTEPEVEEEQDVNFDISDYNVNSGEFNGFDALFGNTMKRSESSNDKLLKVDAVSSGEWKWNGSDFVWEAAVTTVTVNPSSSVVELMSDDLEQNVNVISSPQTNSGKITSSIVKATVPVQKNVVNTDIHKVKSVDESKKGVKSKQNKDVSAVIDLTDDISKHAILPKKRSNIVEKPSKKVEKVIELNDSSSDVGIDNSSDKSNSDTEVSEGIEVDVSEEDFAPMEWFSRPQQMKTYGNSSSTSKKTMSATDVEERYNAIVYGDRVSTSSAPDSRNSTTISTQESMTSNNYDNSSSSSSLGMSKWHSKRKTAGTLK